MNPASATISFSALKPACLDTTCTDLSRWQVTLACFKGCERLKQDCKLCLLRDATDVCCNWLWREKTLTVISSVVYWPKTEKEKGFASKGSRPRWDLSKEAQPNQETTHRREKLVATLRATTRFRSYRGLPCYWLRSNEFTHRVMQMSGD